MATGALDIMIGLCAGQDARRRLERKRTAKIFQQLSNSQAAEGEPTGQEPDWADNIGGSVTGLRDSRPSFRKPWEEPNFGIQFRYREPAHTVCDTATASTNTTPFANSTSSSRYDCNESNSTPISVTSLTTTISQKSHTINNVSVVSLSASPTGHPPVLTAQLSTRQTPITFHHEEEPASKDHEQFEDMIYPFQSSTYSALGGAESYHVPDVSLFQDSPNQTAKGIPKASNLAPISVAGTDNIEILFPPDVVQDTDDVSSAAAIIVAVPPSVDGITTRSLSNPPPCGIFNVPNEQVSILPPEVIRTLLHTVPFIEDHLSHALLFPYIQPAILAYQKRKRPVLNLVAACKEGRLLDSAVTKQHTLETSKQTVQRQQLQQSTEHWTGGEDVRFMSAREAVLPADELAIHVAANQIVEKWDIKFWAVMNSNQQEADSSTRRLTPEQLTACTRPNMLEIKSTLDKAKYLARQAKVAHDLERAHLYRLPVIPSYLRRGQPFLNIGPSSGRQARPRVRF